jgi:hypothetical protein
MSIWPRQGFARDWAASDCSAGTLRSYAYDLLRWFRFLDRRWMACTLASTVPPGQLAGSYESNLAFCAANSSLVRIPCAFSAASFVNWSATSTGWAAAGAGVGPATIRSVMMVLNFGSQATAVAATRVLRATRALESGATGHMMEADRALEDYCRLVQRDLGLNETHLPAWGSEDDPEWAEVGKVSD